MRSRHVLLAVAVNVLWGVNFAVIDLGLRDLPPLLFCALRFGVAAVPAVFVLRRPGVAWRWVVAVGLALGVAKFGLLFAAMAAGLPAGLSALVLQSQAVFSVVFAVALLGERPGWRRVGGLVLASAGIAVVGLGVRGGPAGGFLLVLAAGAAWGLSNVATRRAAPPDLLRFIVWVSAVAAPVDAVLSLAIEGPGRDLAALRGITVSAVGATAFVAYGATLFGFGAWSALLRRYGASTVAPFAMLAPVCAVAAGALLLGQPVHATDVAGGAAVLCGIGLGLGRPAPAPAPATATATATAGRPVSRLPVPAVNASLKANREV
jgi:O-acetylserine/cysteine efflux transporter